MVQFGVCPRCQSTLAEDRLNFQPLICQSCGFSSNRIEAANEVRFERRFMRVAVGLTAALLGGFMQVVSWDQYALEIIPLKLKQFTGLAAQTDLERVGVICLERRRFDCVEEAYFAQARGGNLEALAALGKFQARRGKAQQSVATLREYFQRGGLDLEASYQFAKVLGEVGQVDLAVNYYDQVIKARPDTLQVSVAQDFVRMLMNNGRRDQALAVIASVRKSSATANAFMEYEYKTLTQAAIK